MKLLGQGQFGQVFQAALVSSTASPVPQFALKISKCDPDRRREAYDEAQFMATYQNLGTPSELAFLGKFFDFFTYKGHGILVLEVLSANLYDVLQFHRFRGLALPVIQRVCRQILQSLVLLERAHIIHGDIKPENIVLADSSSNDIKLIDFGSAHFKTDTILTYVQSRYCRAPEIVLGMPHSHGIDIWSLGCTACELFLGQPLFPGQSEGHLLNLIQEFMGEFPKEMIDAATRREEFFRPSGELKTEREICAEKRIPLSNWKPYFLHDTLADNILAYTVGMPRTRKEIAAEGQRRMLFLSFLNDLLKLDPRQRPSAEIALNHPFLTTDFG
jgi:dual specificity protein kinase YAK1